MAWEDRELPILQVVHENEEHPERRNLDVGGLANQLAWERDRTLIGVRRLVGNDYVTAIDGGTMGGDDWARLRLTEKGLRAVGDWPSEVDLLTALVAAMSDVADEVDDEDQGNRLRKGALALGGVMKDVGVQVAANLASQGIILGG